MKPIANSSPSLDIEAILDTGADALLLDLDGTLTVGDGSVCGAKFLLDRFSGRYAVITNNSSDLPETISRRLYRYGLAVPPSLIFTAGMAMIEHLAENDASSLVFLSPELRAHALARGVTFVEDEAEIVAIGRDTSFDYSALTRAANSVRRGAKLVASNLDDRHPGAAGSVVPETGALVAAVLAAAGPQSVTVIGKPTPHLAEHALRVLGYSAARSVVVGDNLAPDGALADAIGAAFVPVTTCARVAVKSVFRKEHAR